MKNQYFGDINDFRKYIILSAISQQTGFPICFVWMLTPNDGSPDGEKREYLDFSAQWRPLNRAMFDFLEKHNVPPDQRSVAVMQQAPGFRDATFVNAMLSRNPLEQAAYFAQVRDVAGPKDVLFFDPDNGSEAPSVPRCHRKSNKHLYWQDLCPLYAAGHSVIIYQHFPHITHNTFTRQTMQALETRLKPSTAFSIRTTHVLFLVAAQPAHAGKIHAALDHTFNRDSQLNTDNTFEFHDEVLTRKPSS